MKDSAQDTIDKFVCGQLDLTNIALQNLLRLVASIDEKFNDRCLEINNDWVNNSNELIDSLGLD